VRLTEEQIERYSRHILLPEVGGKGQEKLLDAKVLIVGAGGLGSPVATYLAAAGVGTLGLVDGDVVDLSNLQRQILHATPDVGRPKVDSATERIQALNPDVEVRVYPERLTSDNALEIIRDYDIVVDGTDNFPARYLLSDACVLTGRPLVHGSVFRFEGQVTVFSHAGGPCYRCLFPEPPAPGTIPSCAEAGILGVTPGFIGLVQATEVIKLILGVGRPLSGRLLIYDGLAMEITEVTINRDAGCPACGDEPTVTELIDYEIFCGLRD